MSRLGGESGEGAEGVSTLEPGSELVCFEPRFPSSLRARCFPSCACERTCVCWGRVRGVSRRVLHAPKRVLAASTAQAGCGPLGSTGLALWLRGRGGLCLLGRAGIWQLPSWLELPVSSFSPPPTLHPLSFSQAVLPDVLAHRTAGTARPFLRDPSRSLIQPVGEIWKGRVAGCRLGGGGGPGCHRLSQVSSCS